MLDQRKNETKTKQNAKRKQKEIKTKTKITEKTKKIKKKTVQNSAFTSNTTRLTFAF